MIEQEDGGPRVFLHNGLVEQRESLPVADVRVRAALDQWRH